MSVETLEQEHTAPLETQQPAPQAPTGANLFWRIAASVLLLAVISLGVLLFLAKEGLIFQTEVVEEPPVLYSAICSTPAGEPLSVSGVFGETVALPQAPQIEGYTFIGWADADGNLAKRGEVTLYTNVAYRAVYQIAFRDESALASHAPYLPLDGNLLFRPSEALTRAEAVSLIYDFLDTEAYGSEGFVDVPEDAPCFRAAATLKELGVIGGSRLHGDEPISCAELFDILAAFFPASEKETAFTNIPASDSRYAAFCLAMDKGWIDDAEILPDRDLTRAEAAHIFNLLSGRAPVVEQDYAKVGTIYDVSFRDKYFWDIAEACLPHEAQHSAEGESWTTSEALPLRKEGFFFIGTALHCADADGSALVNESYGNFDFGADGVITSGRPELDELVQKKLKDLGIDPSTMDSEKMLRTVYNDVTYHNKYLRIHYYEIGDTSWIYDEAYHMLTEGRGNCYNFASEFYFLVKALGFDAVIYSGTVDPTAAPHAWVEISFDGVPYIFDTELEYTQHIKAHKYTSFYKLPYERVLRWYYVREKAE